ncbi:serine hydrolase domain-containing protein [Nocardia suismassiliense]|uniref:serine hydrolase domain-containing protein n=1 Tax=Nocardia suismassiliense TaxID=2077092 RepID=UPI000D1FD20A|nr:serine hydrolase domain-containing protein [Nocardia suismassiliense]
MLLPSTERALLHRVAVEQAEYRVPSLIAAVVRDGELVWSGARGRVDGGQPTIDTQYRIGSITKSMVATMVLRLRDEGKLDLADPLTKHVPGAPLGDRTVAQLLSHTAGLRAESPGDWWERTEGGDWAGLADSMNGDPGSKALLHRAGRRFHYSNVGFAALGELVAQLRGHSWFEALRAEVLVPLGMGRTTVSPVAPHATGWAVHPWADVVLPEPAHDHGAMGAAGQLWSTVCDLARWAAFLGGDTGDVLAADTLAEMREPAIVTDGDRWDAGYGLGLQLQRRDGRRLAGHTGAMPGFIAEVWADPKDRTGVLFLSNTTYGGIRGKLGGGMLDILAEHEPNLPEEWLPAPEVDPKLLALTGTWYWGSASIALHLRADGLLSLEALAHGGRESRFRPEADGSWTGLDGYYAGERMEVVRGPDGVAERLELVSYVFTRAPYEPVEPIPGGVDPAGWQGRE